MLRHLRRSNPSANMTHVYGTSFSVAERDRLGLVWYPGDTCATLTSQSAQIWVGGPEAGDGGPVTAVEVAYFMGITA